MGCDCILRYRRRKRCQHPQRRAQRFLRYAPAVANLPYIYHWREGCAAVPATLHSVITDAWVGQCADDSTTVHQSDERRRQAARACRGVQLRRPSGFRQSRNAARIIWSKRCRYCPNPIYTIACALKALLLKGFQRICPIHGETDVFEDMNETEGERWH